MAKRGRPKKSEYPPETKAASDRKDEAQEVKDWICCIDRAKKVKEKWREDFRVALGYEYFEGRHRPPHIPAAEWITLNLIYSRIDAKLPALYSTDPYYHVKLAKSYSPKAEDIPAFELKAKVRQSMLNYLKGELDLQAEAQTSILDGMFQFGICKTHLSAEVLDNPKKGEPVLGEDGRPLIDQETGEPVLETEELTANEMYNVTRIDPDDFLVDGNAGPLEKSVRWYGHRIKYPLEDAKQNKRFNASARAYLRATESEDQWDKDKDAQKGIATQGEGKERDHDTVVTWEIYDLREKQWLTVSEGCDHFLRKPGPLPKGIEKHPFSEYRHVKRPNSWYPIPPVSQLIDPQREYCESRSKFLTHRKRFNRKYEVYSAGMVDAQKAMTQLQYGEDGTNVEKNTPQQCVFPIADASLDQQFHMEMAYLKKDFDDIDGGQLPIPGVDSATEAGIIEKRTMTREGYHVNIAMRFLTSIGRKLDQLVQAHLKRDQAVRVVGPEGESWEMVKVDDYREIEGEYQYSIATGSMLPQLPEIERAQLTGFAALFVQAPQLFAAMPMFTRRLLKAHGIDDESIIQEFKALGEMIAQGTIPPGPGATGSQPNTAGTPQARTGGAAGGMNNVMKMRGGRQ